MLKLETDWLPERWAKELRYDLQGRMLEESMWDRYNNPFEQKYVLNKDNYSKVIDDTILHMNSLAHGLFEDLDQKVMSDKGSFTAVFHYGVGDYLYMHKDAARDPVSKRRKLATAILYMSTEGTTGSPLQIWEGTETEPTKQLVSIEPRFNTLVVFDDCWHGNPIPVMTGHRLALTVSFLGEVVEKPSREKAFFAPLPFETWTTKQYELRNLRADPEKYSSVYQVR